MLVDKYVDNFRVFCGKLFITFYYLQQALTAQNFYTLQA